MSPTFYNSSAKTPPHNNHAQSVVDHCKIGAIVAHNGYVSATAVAISQTTSHAFADLELALSSHKIGVIISVCSLPLNTVPSAISCCLCSANALTSSSQNASIALLRARFASSVHSSLSAAAFHSLSIHCQTILYHRFHGLCRTHTQKSVSLSQNVLFSAFSLGLSASHDTYNSSLSQLFIYLVNNSSQLGTVANQSLNTSSSGAVGSISYFSLTCCVKSTTDNFQLATSLASPSGICDASYLA